MTSKAWIRRIVVATAAAALLSVPAAAQERPAEFDGWTFSGVTFTPGISFSAISDSNVALAGRPVTGSTAGDTLLLFVPFGQFDLNSTRTNLSAGYRGHIRRFLDVEGLNGYEHRAFASIRHRLTPRLTVFGQNGFTESPTTDIVELNGLPFARIGARSNRASAGLHARLSPLTDLGVRYENTWTSFDRFEDLLADGMIHSVSVDLRRRLSTRMGFGGEARLRRSSISGIEDERVIWFEDVGGLLDYRLAEFTTVALAGGLSRLRDSRQEASRADPYFRIELQHQEERATVGVAFERSYTPSFGLSGSNNNRELRGFVRMPFSRNRFYVHATAMWRRAEPFFAGELRLDTVVTDATVGYSALRWFRIEAYHGYSRQDSAITGGEVSRHRLGTQVVVSQPMRIR